MALSEFEVIERYFSSVGERRRDVVLGVGDDAAILAPPAGHELVVSTDTLLEGVHFFEDVDPESLGHKSLAVNLSDIAAMGAQPAWVTLGLTLPSVNEAWLAAFSKGFSELAQRYSVQLVGGDTTRGPLAINVQVMGHVERGHAWRRSGAQPGDLIYVTGTLGDAGLALQLINRGNSLPEQLKDGLLERLQRPEPRLAMAQSLRGVVTAAIDLSDGLLSDLGHLLKASGAGAAINLDRLPLSSSFLQSKRVLRDEIPADEWQLLPLTAGDDYELCFTVTPACENEMVQLLSGSDVSLSRIGVIEEGAALRCLYEDGAPFDLQQKGYDHFR